MEAASAHVNSDPTTDVPEVDLGAGGFRPVLIEGTTEVLTVERLRGMCQSGLYRVVESGLDDEGRGCVQVVIETGHGHSALGGRPVWTYYTDSTGRLYRKL